MDGSLPNLRQNRASIVIVCFLVSSNEFMDALWPENWCVAHIGHEQIYGIILASEAI